MMRPIILQAALFRDHGDDPEEHERSRTSMLYLLSWLVMHDRLWLRTYPDTPSIYASGVKYINKDDIDAPAWQDVSVCLAKGTGDCKDFAAWRCAELLEQGIDCRPCIQWRIIDGTSRFHALVEYPDGTLEDPSIMLGMKSTRGFITPPEDDEVDPYKVAEDVVNGLFLGKHGDRDKAKASIERLEKLSGDDEECAKALAIIHRACGRARTELDNGSTDLRGVVQRSLARGPRSRSIFDTSVTGDDPAATATPGANAPATSLNQQTTTALDVGGSALLSLIPGAGIILAPLAPAIVKSADVLITQAQKGDKKAMGKIADTAAKAKQGDPQAQQDLDALKRVKQAKDQVTDALTKQYQSASWNPFSLYKIGLGPNLQ